MKERCVIYNARDIDAVTRPRNSGAPFVFGFIGGLTPVKGTDQLIRAFHKISGGADVKLLVAGRGDHSYVESLHVSSRGSPIEFLGYIPSKDFYPRIDALVVPSLWHEPLASVVFEALGHGVPVIGTRRGGIPEMISDGVNGLLMTRMMMLIWLKQCGVL